MAPFFERHDILLTATLAEPPAEIGRYRHVSEDFEAYRMGPGGVFDYSPFTALFNATGQPAASLPTHWTPDGLPVGIRGALRRGRAADRPFRADRSREPLVRQAPARGKQVSIMTRGSD